MFLSCTSFGQLQEGGLVGDCAAVSRVSSRQAGTVSKTPNVRETLTVKECSHQTLPEQGGRMGVPSCKASP